MRTAAQRTCLHIRSASDIISLATPIVPVVPVVRQHGTCSKKCEGAMFVMRACTLCGYLQSARGKRRNALWRRPAALTTSCTHPAGFQHQASIARTNCFASCKQSLCQRGMSSESSCLSAPTIIRPVHIHRRDLTHQEHSGCKQGARDGDHAVLVAPVLANSPEAGACKGNTHDVLSAQWVLNANIVQIQMMLLRVTGPMVHVICKAYAA